MSATTRCAPELEAAGVKTREQISGSNGAHLIFKGAPDGFRFSSMLDEQKGVDVIHNAHRYLVAAPSRHWTGGVYRWANDLPIATVPGSLLVRCERGAGKRSKSKAKVRETTLATMPGAELTIGERLIAANTGKREVFAFPKPMHVPPIEWANTLAITMPPAISNDEPDSTEPGRVTLSRAGAALIALGLDHDTALAVLWRHYNPRCVPPWTDDDAGDFERVVRAAGRHIEASNDTAGVTGGEPVVYKAECLGTLYDPAVEPPELNYRVLNFAPSKTSAITAYAYTSKTPFALLQAICVATGKAFLGNQTVQCKVLYCAAEGAPRCTT